MATTVRTAFHLRERTPSTLYSQPTTDLACRDVVREGGSVVPCRARGMSDAKNVKDDSVNREAPRHGIPQQQQQQQRGRRARFRERRREAARLDDSDDEVPAEAAAPPDEVLGDRQRRIQEYEEKRRARDAEREVQEEMEAAERLRKAEERRQREEEEAAKWAEFITVEEQGENEEAADEENALQQFVDAIMSRKIVVLEDTAVEFGIKTQEVIHRIEALEAAGRLTGVMDDRGKYVYISEDEMRCVADFIVSRGRVSIRELAHVSHRFVNLETRT